MKILGLMLSVYLLAAGIVAQEPREGSIAGIVLDDTTDEPLTGVTVFLENTSLRTSTVPDGRFRLNRARAGSAILHADKAGYSSARVEGRKIPGNVGIPVLIAAPEDTILNIRLRKAPILSGRILDLRGKPIQGLTVTAFRYTYDNDGNLSPSDQGRVVSNDLGYFRFNNLDPGRYGFRVDAPTLNLGQMSPALYYSSYYPGTDGTSAELMHLDAGSEIELRDLLVPSSHGGNLRLRLIDESAQPFRSIEVRVRRRGENSDVRQGIVQAGITEIQVGELLPGIYDVQIEAGRMQRVLMVEMDTRDLVKDVVLTPPVPVTGTIQTESDPSGQSSPVAGVTVQLFGTDFPRLIGGVLRPTRSTRSGEQGLFDVSLSPGTYRLNAEGLPDGTYLTAIHDGRNDLLRSPLEVEKGRPVSLSLIIGTSAGSIHGSVLNLAGDAVPGAAVALLPVERGDGHRIVARVADARGTFELQCAPGTYRLFAWTELDGEAYRNAEFMSKFNQGLELEVHSGSRLSMRVVALEPALQ